jgi:hypothetical protein
LVKMSASTTSEVIEGSSSVLCHSPRQRTTELSSTSARMSASVIVTGTVPSVKSSVTRSARQNCGSLKSAR